MRLIGGIIFVASGIIAGIGCLVEISEGRAGKDWFSFAGAFVVFSAIPVWFGLRLINRYKATRKRAQEKSGNI